MLTPACHRLILDCYFQFSKAIKFVSAILTHLNNSSWVPSKSISCEGASNERLVFIKRHDIVAVTRDVMMCVAHMNGQHQ